MDKKKIWIFSIIIVVFIIFLSLMFFSKLTGFAIQAPPEEEQKEENYVEISWEEIVVSNVIKQKIAIATECIGPVNEENCNWQYTDLSVNDKTYKDYEIEPVLKFYKVIVTASDNSICKPECSSSCGLLTVAGWVDSCTNECIKIADCSGQEAYCCLIDSDSQGWYDLPCNELANVHSIQEHLIKYDGSCHLSGEECTQESDIYVKFTQGFNRAASLGEPSINWIVNFIPESSTGAYVVQGSKEMLKLYASVFDYVAYWDPSQQKQYGAAHGLLSSPQPSANYIITGPFDMQQGKPYFTSVKYNYNMVWVGKMPAPVTFKFKRNEQQKPYNENYIVLPFNTQIKTAKNLCTELINAGIMSPSDSIEKWDVINQRKMTPFICTIPTSGFDLEPGIPYLITVTNEGTWTQK